MGAPPLSQGLNLYAPKGGTLHSSSCLCLVFDYEHKEITSINSTQLLSILILLTILNFHIQYLHVSKPP